MAFNTKSGAGIVARSLKEQGVDYMFGIVGIPVIETGFLAQAAGITYVGMRNEQAASYAAGAVGYMTQRPGACLVVSGPGVIHAIAGLANARENCWPMILLGGASDSMQDGTGAFQEYPQLESCRLHCKYAARVDSVERIPYFVQQAVWHSITGRPGPVYLDLPGNFLIDVPAEGAVIYPPRCPDPPQYQADPSEIAKAVAALKSAKRPLIIVGKGASYGRADQEITAFIDATGIPFLPSPMGKGCVPDDHPSNVIAARTMALQQSDCVLLVCARLNWILHFGLPPRFDKSVKVLQIDIEPSEIGHNVPASASMVGSAKMVCQQLVDAQKVDGFTFDQGSEWVTGLKAKVAENVGKSAELMADRTVPMNYYCPLKLVQDMLPRDAFISSEGAATMDIGRTILENYLPRHRLDAATFGTMGVGVAQAIAACVVNPDKKTVCVEGDSGFGFALAELEVCCRYKLPITFVIINNNGIGGGPTKLPDTMEKTLKGHMVTGLTPECRYDVVCEALGGEGYFCHTPEEVEEKLPQALKCSTCSVVNIMINPSSQRKKQAFDWLSRGDDVGEKEEAPEAEPVAVKSKL